MAQVYSQRVLWVHGGGSKYYNVPTGYRLVTRWISSFNAQALTSATFNVSITGLDVTICQLQLGPQASAQTDIRQVLEEGDELLVSADMGVDVTITGYLLTLP
jgi:hypothetical protein